MIYGPGDKPIIPETAKHLRSLTVSWYKKSVLKALENKMRFTDWWGPRLYDQFGDPIMKPPEGIPKVITGRPRIQFFRKAED